MSSNLVSSDRVPTSGHARARGAAAVVALLAGVTALASCDSTATLFRDFIFFDRAMIVGAHPAVMVGGQWVRECNAGQADGVILDVALISTQRQTQGSSDVEDKDLAIRPNDVIRGLTVGGPRLGDIQLDSEGNIEVGVECIDPQPHPDPSGASCQGAKPSFSLEEVRFIANNEARGDGHNVLFLIDQSGSISGLVDASRTGEPRNFVEDAPGTFEVPGNFGDLRSDPVDSRLAVANTFLRTLNVANNEDRFGAIAFSERYANGVKVPCAEATGDFQGDMEACFGKRNTDLWRGTLGINSLLGDAQGRSNLWRAVDRAYDFLETLDDPRRSNHIIVVTDGPDTCVAGEELTVCSSGCSTVDAQQVLDRVSADQADPNGPRIRLHFIQFESLGYPGRDPRQLAASCLSGGHYQYINSNVFPSGDVTPFEEALETAIITLRHMLSGHWQMAAGVPAYSSSAAPPTGTLPGSLYALDGLLTIKSTSNMVDQDAPFPFDIGQGEQADSATAWDRRPTLRKPCSAPTDCGAAGPGGACDIICSGETLTCPGGPSGVTAPDTSACTLDSGGQGFCCQGVCEPLGGVCSTCAQ